MHQIKPCGDSLGACGRYCGSYLPGYFLRSLVGNQAETDLRGGAGWDYSFRSFSGVAATDAMNFECWPGPDSGQYALARFSGQRGRADFAQAKLLGIEGQPVPGVDFGRRGRDDAIVKAPNKNLPIAGFK